MSPKDVEIWIAKANVAARRGKEDQAQKKLTEAKAKLGDQVAIRLAEAAHLARTNRARRPSGRDG